jgi:ABC-type Fe3+-hydroxamate transport system substrate-binding protein
MRVVSLVPSATETLLALGVTPVACTRFCEQPGIPTVGGTKNPDLEAIVGLAPDLVVVNDEENRREDADALVAAGLELHSMSPRSFADVGPAVSALAAAVGVAVPLPAVEPAAPLAPGDVEPVVRRRCVVFVWRRPWMTLGTDTYAASLLSRLGYDQVALGVDGDRYPEVELGVVAATAPELILLPDEPYAFTELHRAEVGAAVPGADVSLVDGRDLFWWGVRSPLALERLRVALGGAQA